MELIEFEVDKTLGIDVEREDRSVGIFGNNFLLGFETKGKKQVTISFFDEEFDYFLDKIEPFITERNVKRKLGTALNYTGIRNWILLR